MMILIDWEKNDKKLFYQLTGVTFQARLPTTDCAIYEVTDEKEFFLSAIKHSITFETLNEDESAYTS
jgi:hypothetical protein